MCLSVGIAFLRVVEHVASDKFMLRCAAEAGDSGKYVCRMLAAHGGALRNAMAQEVRKLMDPCSWLVLRAMGCTVAMSCKAFSIMYATECALQQLVLNQVGGFPWILFNLVVPSDGLIDQILNTPKCMLDAFSKLFLKRFGSPALLKKHIVPGDRGQL